MSNELAVNSNQVRRWSIDEDVVAFQFSRRSWGIKRTGDLKTLLKVREQAAAMEGRTLTEQERDQAYKLTKQLIVSPEYDAICDYLYRTKEHVTRYAVPSFFREGTWLYRLQMVETIEEYLSSREPGLQALIEAFQAVYEGQVETARAVLERDGQFNPRDYPHVSQLPALFGWTHLWIDFRTPDRLPGSIREREMEKLRNLWDDAAESITGALRESFKELTDHLVERLTPGPDGKPKTFRNTLLANVTDFLDTFTARNLTNDTELESLVNKAKAVLSGVDQAQVLRDNEAVKAMVRGQFQRISQELGAMVTERPGRKFRLDD